MPLEHAPERLLGADGHVRFGMFDTPLADVDLEDARILTRPRGIPSGLRLKQWQHFCIVHPEVVLTIAVVDLGFMKATWVKAIDREAGTDWEISQRGRQVDVEVARSLWNAHTWSKTTKLSVCVHNHLTDGAHVVDVVTDPEGKHTLDAHFRCLHDASSISPLVVSLPVGMGRAMYSHKVPLPVEGKAVIDGREVVFDPAHTTAVLDIHKAHYPRKTWWNWVTFAGFDARGRRIGLNLTKNVVTDDAFHENAVWIDGALTLLGPATFDLSGDAWTMGTADGRVSLSFQADGDRRENLNVGLVASKFLQRFGRFSGQIQLEGDTIDVVDMFGLAEDHYAVW